MSKMKKIILIEQTLTQDNSIFQRNLTVQIPNNQTNSDNLINDLSS